MARQRATGYGRRSLAETAVGRHKGIIGPKLRARTLPARQGEVAVAAEVLDRMIRVAKPVSTRAVRCRGRVEPVLSGRSHPCTSAMSTSRSPCFGA